MDVTQLHRRSLESLTAFEGVQGGPEARKFEKSYSKLCDVVSSMAQVLKLKGHLPCPHLKSDYGP